MTTDNYCHYNFNHATSGMNYKINLHLHNIVVPQNTTLIVTSPSNEICDIVAGVSVAVSVPITSIITAIVSTTIMYLCCVKRTVPPVYETPTTTTVDIQSTAAYDHASGGKTSSTAVYAETVSTDL